MRQHIGGIKINGEWCEVFNIGGKNKAFSQKYIKIISSPIYMPIKSEEMAEKHLDKILEKYTRYYFVLSRAKTEVIPNIYEGAPFVGLPLVYIISKRSFKEGIDC